MSATRSQDATDSVVNQGEFSSHVPRTEPEDDALKHKPGVKATPADFAPEFTTETYPPGTAPANRSFKPNNSGEALPTSEDQTPSASDTLGGSTSGQVHKTVGHEQAKS
ncbi:uncharacterized protein K452DRAFT_317598 [Aplosporella prunicola CBS 121167]|uniref:Uncharacterized protein n=1 Tax=Aplosporella prunicola CBS 121167 TaxID=1176127 RepID=A0A6A6BLN8_9PEZI|nr:uncharacterized protein K452DRAFT_317598 [Aplosporella prunicola CBS 121167]KAF2143461.1 hypothetical protein K452DRAFT_317598 [Aplosporella prunicola CBS 121167]